jgi:hypothetical protein
VSGEHLHGPVGNDNHTTHVDLEVWAGGVVAVAIVTFVCTVLVALVLVVVVAVGWLLVQALLAALRLAGVPT